MKDTKSVWLGISVLATTLVSLSFSSVSYGQAAAADDEPLEEIVVTAQRRVTELMRTALAASVITGEALKDRGVTDLVAVQYAAPSLIISDYGSANVFNIRGIGRTKVDIEVPSGVVIYADGVPMLAGYFQNEPYFDMASVEVLRGPQGTVAGKSASGGAVFLNTRSPDLGETSGNIELGIGEHQLFEARGAVNLPASESVAFRAAFNYENRDNYYDAITGPYTGSPNENDLLSLRVGMLIEPNDQLSVLAKVSYADLDFGGNITTSYGDPLFNVHQDAPFEYTDESTRVVLDIDYTFDNGVRFSSLTGYQDLDTVNNLDLNATVVTPTYWFKSAGVIDMVSQEFNLVSPDDQPLRWVLGAFYQNQESELLPIDQFGFTFVGNGNSLAFPWFGSPWIKDEDDWAIFAHVIYDLNEDLELELGVRYSDYEMSQFTEYLFGDGTTAPFIPFAPLIDPTLGAANTQTLAEDSVDWKIGLNWSPSDNHFLYAVISRGHTTGSVNIFPPYGPYKEMEVQNIDVGWKMESARGNVRTSISAYYENIENWQAAFQDLDIPLSSATAVRNADSDSTIYGVELTTEADIDPVSIDFSVAYNDSELGTFDNIVHPFTLNTFDLTGAKFPFAPDLTAMLGLEFNGEMAGASTSLRFDASYNAETQADVYFDPEFTIPSRTLLNAQLRVEKDEWYAVLWATNLTDKKYVAAIQNTATLYYSGPRRQSGLRIGRNF